MNSFNIVNTLTANSASVAMHNVIFAKCLLHKYEQAWNKHHNHMRTNASIPTKHAFHALLLRDIFPVTVGKEVAAESLELRRGQTCTHITNKYTIHAVTLIRVRTCAKSIKASENTGGSGLAAVERNCLRADIHMVLPTQ